MNQNSMFFIGLDLGDKHSHLAILDPNGDLIEETRLPTTQAAFHRKFSGLPPARVAMEVGTHSHWASHLLINHARSIVKSTGARLPSCSADSFAHKVAPSIPEQLQPALIPLVETIGSLTQQIRAYDRQIETLCQTQYPETRPLQQVSGVGALTALAFVLTLEDPARFAKSREVGPALGLVPRRDPSGDRDPQLPITKTGNAFLRRLLVGSAHYVLGPCGPYTHPGYQGCDLRRWGLQLAERGGKNAKKRAVVAVARKLAVLLHRLWKDGEIYDPFYSSSGRVEETEVVAALA